METDNSATIGQPRERGHVGWFKQDKGYGRIVSDEFGDQLFVHFSSIASTSGAAFRLLEPGQRVEYTRTLGPGPQGTRPVAIDVVVLTPL
jgi:CspA family cold shock protein